MGRGFPPLVEAVAFLGVHGSILVAALFVAGVLPRIRTAGPLVLLSDRFFSPSVSFLFFPAGLFFFQMSTRFCILMRNNPTVTGVHLFACFYPCQPRGCHKRPGGTANEQHNYQKVEKP